MKPDDVKAKVAEIEAIKTDDETAHSMEDDLYSEILQAVASGELKGAAAKGCAAEALKTRDIGFSRWYA